MGRQLFFSSAVTLLCVLAPFSAWAVEQQQAIEDIVKRSSEIVEERGAIAGEEATTIRDRQADTMVEDGWQHPQMPDGRAFATGVDDTTQQKAWNEFAKAVEGMPKEYVGVAPPRQKVPDDAMYVFISLSMPEASIRELFFQALQEADRRKTIFIIRGWTPPHIQQLVSRLNNLFPEAEELQALPNVQINPSMYQRAAVEVVPTYIQKDARGVWRRLVGETSLAEASRRITSEIGLESVIGPVYKIEEPDVLKIMQERLASHDWEADVRRARDNIYQRTSAVEVENAQVRDSYLVDLTVQANRNLEGANAQIFAYAGQTINPFDYMTITRRYLFFDANDDSHVSVVRGWLSEHPTAMLISTAAVSEEGRRRSLLAEFGQPVHEANAMLVKKFRLRAVPAMAYQDGRMLRVDVKPGKPVTGESRGRE